MSVGMEDFGGGLYDEDNPLPKKTKPVNEEPDVIKEALARGNGDEPIEQIIHIIREEMGCPKDYTRTNVHRVWKNHYRANVHAIGNKSEIITDSFFVKDTASGFEFKPPLEHKYLKDEKCAT